MKQQQGFRLRSFQDSFGSKDAVEHILIGAHDDIDQRRFLGDFRRAANDTHTQGARLLQRRRVRVITNGRNARELSRSNSATPMAPVPITPILSTRPPWSTYNDEFLSNWY